MLPLGTAAQRECHGGWDWLSDWKSELVGGYLPPAILKWPEASELRVRGKQSFSDHLAAGEITEIIISLTGQSLIGHLAIARGFSSSISFRILLL